MQDILQPTQQAEILQGLEDSEPRTYSSGLSMSLTWEKLTVMVPGHHQKGFYLFLLNKGGNSVARAQLPSGNLL